MSEVQTVQLEESSRTVSNGTVCVSSVRRNPWRNSFLLQGHQLINNQNYSQKLKKILNPGGRYWNWVFLGVYVLSISLDSSFFYIPVIDGYSNCLALVKNLAFALVVFRSLFDIFHVIYVIFESNDADDDVPGNNSWANNATKYLLFINAILSILPIPLVLHFIVIPKMRGLEFEVAMSWLKYLVLAQYVPRAIRTYQLFTRATNRAGVYAVILANAAFNFLVILIVSHGFGALWYFIAIERVNACWRQACIIGGYSHDSFHCDHDPRDPRILNTSCPIKIRDPTVFYFGMFHDALQTGIVEVTTNFHQKFLYCFQWGIRSLCCSRIVWIIFIVENHCSEHTRQFFRSMVMAIYLSILNCREASNSAQNFETSAFFLESSFSLVMTITGVALISSLFENVKKLLEYYYKEISAKILEKWRLFQMLCDDLQQEVRNHHQTVWQATAGFNVYQFFNDLPRNINRKFKLQLCSPVLKKVFDSIDVQFSNAMLDHLKLVPYTERSILVHEGDRVEKMFFIVRGEIRSQPNAGNGGHFCGEELLQRASVLQLEGLPISTRTVIAHTQVEAFVIEAHDWKRLVNSFMLPDDRLPYVFI